MDYDSHSIWDYLKSDTCRHLAIIGSPGSGKTTLLKHLALALIQRKKLNRKVKTTVKLPILLFLRDYAQLIKEKPEYEITQAICDQLTRNKVTIPSEWFNARLKKGKVFPAFHKHTLWLTPESPCLVPIFLIGNFSPQRGRVNWGEGNFFLKEKRINRGIV